MRTAIQAQPRSSPLIQGSSRWGAVTASRCSGKRTAPNGRRRAHRVRRAEDDPLGADHRASTTSRRTRWSTSGSSRYAVASSMAPEGSIDDAGNGRQPLDHDRNRPGHETGGNGREDRRPGLLPGPSQDDQAQPCRQDRRDAMGDQLEIRRHHALPRTPPVTVRRARHPGKVVNRTGGAVSAAVVLPMSCRRSGSAESPYDRNLETAPSAACGADRRLVRAGESPRTGSGDPRNPHPGGRRVRDHGLADLGPGAPRVGRGTRPVSGGPLHPLWTGGAVDGDADPAGPGALHLPRLPARRATRSSSASWPASDRPLAS